MSTLRFQLAFDINLNEANYLKWRNQYFTPETKCVEIVRQDAESFRCIPDEFKTGAVCLAAVGQSGALLKYVPEQHRTEAVCHAAIATDDWELKYIPEEFRNETICLAAVQKKWLGIAACPHLSAQRNHVPYRCY